jgi:hypothetical protein
MDTPFTVQLFDILVYLIPGAITAAGIWLFFRRVITKLLPNIAPTVRIVTLILSAFFLGVVLHATAESAYSLYQRIIGRRFIQTVAGQFQDIELVRRIVKDSLQVNLANDGDVYRYAEVVVLERTQNQSSSVSRFIALSVFCRNSMLALIVFSVGLTKHLASERLLAMLQKRKRLLVVIAAFLSLVILETLLYRGMNSYSSAAINKVLRTYIVLHQGVTLNQTTAAPNNVMHSAADTQVVK